MASQDCLGTVLPIPSGQSSESQTNQSQRSRFRNLSDLVLWSLRCEIEIRAEESAALTLRDVVGAGWKSQRRIIRVPVRTPAILKIGDVRVNRETIGVEGVVFTALRGDEIGFAGSQ